MSKKRQHRHGEGTVFQRKDGIWQGAVTLEGGNRQYFYGKTQAVVVKKVRRALSDQDIGRPPVPERLTVAEFLDDWLKVAKSTVRVSTFVRYEEYVRLHIKPELGKLKLARLKAHELDKLYAQKLDSGLSAMTVRHIHAAIHRALSQALRKGLVAVNVADMADPPRVKRPEIKALSLEQARKLLETARGTRFEALYVLALSTALRQGELLALRWKHIDLDNSCLHVVGTLQRSHHDLQISETKTSKSRRKVELGTLAVSALSQHRERQLEERLKAGPRWEDGDLVFPNELGKPMDAGNLLRRYFSPLLEKAGIPHVRFHDLRHSAATLLLSDGNNPKVIQEMLGHSSITLTLDTYSHVTPTMQKEAAKSMDRMLNGLSKVV